VSHSQTSVPNMPYACPGSPLHPQTLQALQFLVLGHKSALSAEELARHLCPALDQAQLYRLATTSWSEAPGEGEWGAQPGGMSKVRDGATRCFMQKKPRCTWFV
jgi:hypothetical protein